MRFHKEGKIGTVTRHKGEEGPVEKNGARAGAEAGGAGGGRSRGRAHPVEGRAVARERPVGRRKSIF